MEKVTYTPTEFAAVFGKERTWAYRLLSSGKVRALTKLGRTMIPRTEVDRLLGTAGRYLGAGFKPWKCRAVSDHSKGVGGGTSALAKAKNAIGQQLSRIRADRGMTQSQLVALFQRKGWNVSLQTLGEIELGTRSVTDIELLEIAEALEVPVSMLFPPRKKCLLLTV